MCFGGFEPKIKNVRILKQSYNRNKLFTNFNLPEPQSVQTPRSQKIGTWKTQEHGCWFNVAAWLQQNPNHKDLIPVYGYIVSCHPTTTAVKLLCHAFLKNKHTGKYTELTPSRDKRRWDIVEDPEITWAQASHIILQRADKYETQDVYMPESSREATGRGLQPISREKLSKVVVAEPYKKLMDKQVTYILNELKSRPDYK